MLLREDPLAKTKTDDVTEQKLGQFLVLNYVLYLIGFLQDERHQKLNDLSEQFGTDNWKDTVERELVTEYGLDGTGIQKVFAACVKHMNGMHSLLFVLRGIGCPTPITSLVESFGEDGARALGERIVSKYPDRK